MEIVAEVFPKTIVGFFKLAVPVVAPKVIVVAAPNPLMFVDTVLNTAIVAPPITDVVNVGDVSKTSAPVPVSPVTAAAKLELDGVAKNVATLAPRPSIPVETGRPVQLVRVPEAGVPSAGPVRVGDVRVLFVKVSVVSRPTSVVVAVGNVIVPVFEIEEIIGVVNVLLVKVSVVARPTKVSLVIGNVTRATPPLVWILAIIGVVIVLLVRVSPPANVAKVPVDGSVTFVLAPTVRVVENAPDVTKLPPIVIDLPVFATPVPPYAALIVVPCQVPLPIVPTVVREEVTTAPPRVVAFRTDVPLI